MSAIPEELLREAQEIAANIPRRVLDAHRGFAASVIARALLSRIRKGGEG